MKLQGITIDFNDKRTCGLLPELCLAWDEKYDELDDNQELINYWESNLKKITDKVDSKEIGEIKAEWVDTLKMFLVPLLDMDVSEGHEPAFHCYILEK